MSPRVCILVDVDGEAVRGTFTRQPTDEDLDAFREVIRGVRAQLAKRHTRGCRTCGVSIEFCRASDVGERCCPWCEHDDPNPAPRGPFTKRTP